MATLNLQNLNLPINLRGKSSKSIEAFLKEYTNLDTKQIEELTFLKRGDDPLLNVSSSNGQGFLYETIYLLNIKGYEYTLEKLTNIANDYKARLDSNFILENSIPDEPESSSSSSSEEKIIEKTVIKETVVEETITKEVPVSQENKPVEQVSETVQPS
jgi:hypothetical protein